MLLWFWITPHFDVINKQFVSFQVWAGYRTPPSWLHGVINDKEERVVRRVWQIWLCRLRRSVVAPDFTVVMKECDVCRRPFHGIDVPLLDIDISILEQDSISCMIGLEVERSRNVVPRRLHLEYIDLTT